MSQPQNFWRCTQDVVPCIELDSTKHACAIKAGAKRRVIFGGEHKLWRHEIDLEKHGRYTKKGPCTQDVTPPQTNYLAQKEERYLAPFNPAMLYLRLGNATQGSAIDSPKCFTCASGTLRKDPPSTSRNILLAPRERYARIAPPGRL